jgi:hypothetical protein
MCGIKNVKTLAYSKEENGMVERSNKEVLRHLRNLLFTTNVVGNWEDHLGPVMHIMNNQKRGYSFPAPARLLFGDKIYTDENLFQAPAATFVDGIQLQLSPWASAMIRHQEAIVNLATTLQKDKDMAHLGKQLWEGPMTEFQVGSYVLAKYHSTAGVVQHRGPPNKLLSHLRGPFKIVRHDKDSNTYIIQSLITSKPRGSDPCDVLKSIHTSSGRNGSILKGSGHT